MTFSGALTLTDLNDFITPSQACIKPVEQIKPPSVEELGGATTQIAIDSSGRYYEVATPKPEKPSTGKKLQAAQVSLNDCLACSGCITSAESVLITMQSHEEVLSFLSSNPAIPSQEHRLPVLSISPQSLASLASSTSSTSGGPVPLQAILRRVETFCRDELAFAHVFDTTFARHLVLLEHAKEFNERSAARGDGETNLPMLGSACPGWVCYAEKAHAEMLPFISRTKSPQQVMGALVKQWMAGKWCRTPDQIYHVTVMPCYDKKLEASRQDFYNDVYKTRDVDCVITTGELERLMRAKGWDLSARVAGEDEPGTRNEIGGFVFPELIFHPGTSSGSYLHSLISLVSTSPNNRRRTLKLNSRTIRSADYQEYTLADIATGEIVFKGAKCYGFRNLQNVVRKVGKENGVRGLPGGAVRGRARRKEMGQGTQDRGYDYVEVMACPSGCVNGGGQLRPWPWKKVSEDKVRDAEGYQRKWDNEDASEDGGGLGSGMAVDAAAKWGDKDWIRKVEAAYWIRNTQDPGPSFGSLSGTHSGPDPGVLATHILTDLCRPTWRSSATTEEVQASLSGGKQKQTATMHDHLWMHDMDGEAEATRREIFRTTYRKVESEVVGLAVKW